MIKVISEILNHLHEHTECTMPLHWPPNIFKNVWHITDNACGGHYSCNKVHFTGAVSYTRTFKKSSPSPLKKKSRSINQEDLGGQAISPSLPIHRISNVRFNNCTMGWIPVMLISHISADTCRNNMQKSR